MNKTFREKHFLGVEGVTVSVSPITPILPVCPFCDGKPRTIGKGDRAKYDIHAFKDTSKKYIVVKTCGRHKGRAMLFATLTARDEL